MERQLLHIFRNTPLGRELLLQSTYFCKTLGITPVVYIPLYTKFLIYFTFDVVQVDLDNSYLQDPSTSRKHVQEIFEYQGMPEPDFLHTETFTAAGLPDLPSHFSFMCCPRSVSDLSTKIGLGYIGPKVRRLIQAAHFPVLLGSAVYKKWQSITVLFGGSRNAIKALRLGLDLSRLSGLPLDVFTQEEGKQKEEIYKKVIRDESLDKEMEEQVREWQVFKSKDFTVNLYRVPHDSLVILGAYGHGVIKELIFGSTMETVQTVLPNNLLIAGPNMNYRPEFPCFWQ
ncbi:MAG: universal stress protein [Thermodesulfobacteriota bacterium]